MEMRIGTLLGRRTNKIWKKFDSQQPTYAIDRFVSECIDCSTKISSFFFISCCLTLSFSIIHAALSQPHQNSGCHRKCVLHSRMEFVFWLSIPDRNAVAVWIPPKFGDAVACAFLCGRARSYVICKIGLDWCAKCNYDLYMRFNVVQPNDRRTYGRAKWKQLSAGLAQWCTLGC